MSPTDLQNLQTLFHTAAAALVTAAVGALTTWLVQLARRAGVALSQAQQDHLQSIIIEGVHYAEELGAQQVKAGANKMLGSQKLGHAVDYVLAKLPGADADDIKSLIHATLPQIDLGAAAPKAGA